MLDSKDLMVEISVTILIPASIVHIGKRHKISRCFMISRRSNVVHVQYLLKTMSITFMSNKWETAMTSQGHVTTASLNKQIRIIKRGILYPRASQKVLHIHPLNFTQYIEGPSTVPVWCEGLIVINSFPTLHYIFYFLCFCCCFLWLFVENIFFQKW